MGSRPGGQQADRWVDVRTAVAWAGVTTEELAWAMAAGDIRFTTDRPGHERTPMVLLADVEWLAQTLHHGRVRPALADEA